ELDLAVALAGDEVVLVLRRDEDLDGPLVLVEVHGDLDHAQALEEVEQFQGFLTDHLLGGLAQVAVPGGDLDLHKWAPWVVARRRGRNRPGGDSTGPAAPRVSPGRPVSRRTSAQL